MRRLLWKMNPLRELDPVSMPILGLEFAFPIQQRSETPLCTHANATSTSLGCEGSQGEFPRGSEGSIAFQTTDHLAESWAQAGAHRGFLAGPNGYGNSFVGTLLRSDPGRVDR